MTNASQQVLLLEPVEQAAHWHALMQSGDVSAEEASAFQHWHNDEQHAATYQRIIDMWGSVDRLESAAPANTLRTTVEQVLADARSNHSTDHRADERANSKAAGQRTKQRTATTLATAGLLVIGLVFGLQNVQPDSRLASYLLSGRLFADYSTATGEQRVITLADQTQVHLNTFSAINVEYRDQQRIIHLLQGEIRLDVAKDVNRPFTVVTDQGSARALGTQFSVHDQGDQTTVAVTESRVEVCATNRQYGELSGNQAAPCQQLRAGQHTLISQHQVQPPQATNPDFTHDWAAQLLVVYNRPALELLDELARYHRGYLSIDREALKPYQVSGVFPLNNISKSLDVLEGSLPLKISRYTGLLTRVGVE